MSHRSSQKDSFTETKYKFWCLRPNHTFEIVVHGHAFLLSSFLACGLAWTWCIWRWLLQTICQSWHRFVACKTRHLTSVSLCYFHVSDDDNTMRETEWWSEWINEWVSKWMNDWVCLLQLFLDIWSFICSIVVTGDLCIIPRLLCSETAIIQRRFTSGHRPVFDVLLFVWCLCESLDVVDNLLLVSGQTNGH